MLHEVFLELRSRGEILPAKIVESAAVRYVVGDLRQGSPSFVANDVGLRKSIGHTISDDE